MGKKRIEDADITLEEAIALLEHPQAEKSHKTGSIEYHAGFDLFSLDEVRPVEMVPFIRDRFTPKFVKQYASLHSVMAEAFTSFKADVEARSFPAQEHSVSIKEEQWQALLKELDGES